MPVDPIIIKLQLDDTDLQSGVDKVAAIGDIDGKTAASFKDTNKAIADTSTLLDKGAASATAAQAVYNKLAASVKDLFGQSRDAANQLLKMSAADLTEGLKDKKVSVDELILSLKGLQAGTSDGNGGQVILNDTLEEGADKVTHLRTELTNLNDELAKLRLNGEEGTKAFTDLELQAGKISNALLKQREATHNLASETPALSALQSATEGVTGAFEVGVAVTGLFGDKSKDLEETLVKVNSVMVLANGLQQIFNTLKKDSALRLFLEAQAHAVENAQAAIDNALTSESIVVRTGAATAQKALNLAMEANPIGIVVAALALLVVGLGAYFTAANKAREEQEKVNEALRQNDLLQQHNQDLQRNSDISLALLDKQNAKESDKAKEHAATLSEIFNNNLKQIAAMQKTFDDARLKQQEDADKAVAAATGGSVTKALDAIPITEDLQKLKDAIKKLSDDNDKVFAESQKASIQSDKVTAEESLQIAVDLAKATLQAKVNGSKAFFASERALNDAQFKEDLVLAGNNAGKIALVKANFAKQERDIEAQIANQAANDKLAIDQINLIKIQTQTRRLNNQISEEESIQQDQILKDQTAKQIAALQVQANQDKSFRKEANIQIALAQAQLDQQLEDSARQRQIRRITQAAQDQIAINNIELAGVKISNAQRLDLQEENEHEQTQIALTNQSLTEQQRLAIIAQSEQRITNLRNAAVEKQTKDTIDILNAQFQAENDLLERELAAQSEIRAAGSRKTTVAAQLGVPELNVDQQKAAVDELLQHQLTNNFLQIKANLDLKQSDEDKAKNDILLQKQRDKLIADASERKRALDKDDADFTRQQTLATIQEVSTGATKVIGFLDQVFQAQDAQEQQRLDAKKARIQDELDAGNITAKEAAKRNKEADAEQKKLQVEQAKRQKEIALFTAIINTASAIAVALTGGPILGIIDAAISAAIGAAQIALIASTPLPTFSKGKNKDQRSRDTYEGWGIIGEDGGELWKSGSQMKYADKQTVVWLKKNDVVYTPAQTKEMMGPSGHMNSHIPRESVKIQPIRNEFNYKKLGEEISKRPFSINIDGVAEILKNEQDYVTTLNRKRGWFKR